MSLYFLALLSLLLLEIFLPKEYTLSYNFWRSKFLPCCEVYFFQRINPSHVTLIRTLLDAKTYPSLLTQLQRKEKYPNLTTASGTVSYRLLVSGF